jgi:hypothetical protein
MVSRCHSGLKFVRRREELYNDVTREPGQDCTRRKHGWVERFTDTLLVSGCRPNILALISCGCFQGSALAVSLSCLAGPYIISATDAESENTGIGKQTNSVALSPRAKSTDWATATCQRNLMPTFVDRGVSRSQRGGSPTVVNLSFLDRSRYFSFK